MTPPDVPASYRYVRYDTLGTVIDTVAVPEGEDPKMWTVRAGSAVLWAMTGTAGAAPRSARIRTTRTI